MRFWQSDCELDRLQSPKKEVSGDSEELVSGLS